MKWIPPIKNESTIKKYQEELKKVGLEYYILFEVGINTGLSLQDILSLKNKDIRDKDNIAVITGKKKRERCFEIPTELKNLISEYTKDKDPLEYLISTHNGGAVTKEHAYAVLKLTGKNIGINNIGIQTMRKTFAWRYYKEKKDIYYIQKLFGHASPAISFRYIGEKPDIEIRLNKLTVEENELSRIILCQNGEGKKRLVRMKEFLNEMEQELDNPVNSDAFYGRLDSFVNHFEELIDSFNNESQNNEQ